MYVLCGDARYGEREKTSGQTDLINILTVGAMYKTSDQPQVMLSFFSSNSFNYLRSVPTVLIAVVFSFMVKAPSS
jgi:hypothetical protein